jgi:hypothetical protein
MGNCCFNRTGPMLHMLPLSQSHTLTPMRSKPPRTYIRWVGTALDRQDPRWQATVPWTSCPTAEESVVSVTPSVGRAQTFPLDFLVFCQRPFRTIRSHVPNLQNCYIDVDEAACSLPFPSCSSCQPSCCGSSRWSKGDTGLGDIVRFETRQCRDRETGRRRGSGRTGGVEQASRA